MGPNAFVFSNEEGHKVFYNGGHSARPMSKKEYKEVRAAMIIAASKCEPDKKSKYLDEIAKLDYTTGHNNATFEVITTIKEPSIIKSLAINLGNMRYVYSQVDGNVLKVNLDRTTRSGYMNDGTEKDKIINKITTSKTMAKKIAEIKQK